MMIKLLFLLIGGILTGTHAIAQTLKSELFVRPFQFQAPLDGPMYVSGTFGEPRPNHYHAGLDLKTQGQIGWKVKSVEDGYIARIKVSATGYGNALYVNHPGGLTTVYGHLDKFADPIAQWVKAIQYEKESFEIDTILPDKIFAFKKGEQIAFSGNTGGSAGPHLHFEVRETYSELVLNPMSFGFEVMDKTPPVIGSVKVYPVLKSFYDHKGISVSLKNISSGVWIGETIEVPAGDIMFSIQAFDRQDLTPEHKNGIPGVKMFVEDQLVFHRQLDTIDFSLTKYTHAMVDYCDKYKSGSDFYLATWLPGNLEAGPYNSSPSHGKVHVKAHEEKSIKLQLIDFHGNISTATLKVRGVAEKRDSIAYLSNELTAGSKKLPGASIFWQKESFYDLIPDKIYESSSIKSPYSKSYYIFKNEVFPIHKSLDLKIHTWNVPENLKEKIVLVGENVKNRKKVFSVSMDSKDLLAQVSEASEVYIDVDTIAPKIVLLNYQSSQTFTQQRIQIKISDDLSGIKSYAGYINDKWVLFEYDAKNALLTHHFDGLGKGEHELRISVEDMKNNIAETKVRFKR